MIQNARKKTRVRVNANALKRVQSQSGRNLQVRDGQAFCKDHIKIALMKPIIVDLKKVRNRLQQKDRWGFMSNLKVSPNIWNYVKVRRINAKRRQQECSKIFSTGKITYPLKPERDRRVCNELSSFEVARPVILVLNIFLTFVKCCHFSQSRED